MSYFYLLFTTICHVLVFLFLDCLCAFVNSGCNGNKTNTIRQYCIAENTQRYVTFVLFVNRKKIDFIGNLIWI